MGLDVGTTKVCALIGEVKGEVVNILGVGEAPSKGLRKGVIVDLDATVKSIEHAIVEAEKSADREISEVYVGIASSYIKSFNSHGAITLAAEPIEITVQDRDKVIETAKGAALMQNVEVIHVIPWQYKVDGQSQIKDPVGMYGSRLEVDVHIVTAAVSAVKNLIKAVDQAGIAVTDIVLQPIASGEAVLTEDEKDFGVALIDIGGGTTDISIFYQGSVVYSKVIPLGGSHITSDIAIIFRTLMKEAEMIKKKYGSVLPNEVPEDEEIEMRIAGSDEVKKVKLREVCEVIRERMIDIFTRVDASLKESGFYDKLNATGIVLTGGTSLLRGSVRMAEEFFGGLPVRIGKPRNLGGLAERVDSPIYATAVGLLRYGAKHISAVSSTEKDWLAYIVDRIREFFKSIKI